MLHSQPFSESELIQWISERNQHIPLEDLAFLVQIPSSADSSIHPDEEDYDYIF